MKKFILRNKNAIAGMAACLLIGGVMMSFQDTPYVNQIMDTRIGADTVPDKFSNSTMKMKDFDNLIENLDKDMIRVGDMKDIDMEMIRQQVEMSLKEVDMDKIMKDVEQSLSKIDLTKLMDEIKISLQDIDRKEHEGELKKAIEEGHKELEKAKMEIKNIDREKIRKELQEAKVEIEKARKELKEINMEKIMQEAKAGIDEARVELQQTKAMFTEMEKDGLVNSKQGFSIEFKNKDLYINYVKQPQQVTDKYRKYIKEDHFKIKIEKE